MPRLTGTVARDAVRDDLQGELADLGLDPRVEPFHYGNRAKLALRGLTGLELGASVAKAGTWPAPGFPWVALACAGVQVVLFLLVVTRALVIRWHLYRDAGGHIGYNIHARVQAREEERRRLVIGAHYDSIAMPRLYLVAFVTWIASTALGWFVVVGVGVVRAWVAWNPPWLVGAVWVGAGIEVGAAVVKLSLRKRNLSQGANDNASGVVGVLEVARVLARHPPRFTTVDLVLFDAEEVGLEGSQAYVARHRTEWTGTSGGETGMISLDMIAGSLPLRVVTRSGVPPVTHGTTIARALEAAAADIANGAENPGGPEELGAPPLKRSWFPYFGSDHGPFHLAGVPSAWLFTPGNGANTSRDTRSGVQYSTLARVVALLERFVRRLE